MSTPNLKTIFLEAMERLPGAERLAYLEHACRSDAMLRASIEAMLRDHELLGGFLASEREGTPREVTVSLKAGSSSAPTEPATSREGPPRVLLECRRDDEDAHVGGSVQLPGIVPADDVTSLADRRIPNTGAEPGLGDQTVDRGDGSSDAWPRLGGDEMVTQSGPAAPMPSEASRGAGLDGPKVPGYQVLGKIGHGGMGVVYKARQVGLNRLVALKMIIGGVQAREDLVARFRVEAEAVARLRHPNIMEIYEIGEVDSSPFVSLEFLEGGDLDDRLAGTPQPGGTAAELAATLARAVQAAHAAMIIHRDLKPTNVLFDADGVPKITDFGLAKRLESDSKQTQTGQIMGSPSYMAPEQARGETRDVGPAADIYALGAILYQMLTGRPPFRGETPMETIRQVIDDEPVAPSQLVPRVARDLETICLKCLSKKPEQRYSSAKSLLEDLERFLDGDAILARPTPLLERTWKRARRRPLRAAAAVAAILAPLALLIYWGYREHRMDLLALNQMRKASQLEDKARIAKSTVELSSSRTELAEFLDQLDGADTRRIEGLRDRIRIARADVGARLREAEGREERERSERIEHERFREFEGSLERTQLAATEFDLDSASRQSRLRESARRALAVYARDPRMTEENWVLVDQLPDALTDAERARIIDGCYDLLLLISSAVKPADGLLSLDAAERLRPATAAYHLRRAECLARSGDLAGQLREEDLAAGSPPVTASDHFLIGRELMGLHRWTEAIESFEASRRLDPGPLAPRLLQAICDYNAKPKRLGDALDHLNACLKVRPDLIELYLLRARVRGEVANQALAGIGTARQADRASLRHRAEDAFQGALDDYRDALGRLPSDDYRYVLLVNRGGMLLQAGRLEESRADLDGAVALRPRLYQAYAAMGQLHQRRGRLDDAAAAFGAAIDRVEDTSTRVALIRTRALLHANRSGSTPAERAAALCDLEEVLRLEPARAPKRVDDLVDRARLLFDGSRYAEALDGSAAALRIVPDHPVALRLRISVLMALRRYDDVLSACNGYLESREPTVEVLEIRGLAKLARQQFSGAIADYTRALELRRDLDAATRSRLLNRRGWAYHFVDAPRLAREDFEGSLELLPAQSDGHAGRGLARVRLGDWRGGVADAEAAVRLAGSEDRAGEEDKAAFNAARIYAQAMEAAAAGVGRRGEPIVDLYRGYRARARELLERALRRVSDPARRQEILGDPALLPLLPGLSRSAPSGVSRTSS
jgi:tetratricopeptide (TPR) repeat protein